MNLANEIPEFHKNQLSDLRADSLRIILVSIGIIGYGWLILVMWPTTGRMAPLSAWVGALLLTLGSTASYLLRDRHLSIASHLLVWGIFGAIVCAILTFEHSALAYLFILPIIFASVLFSQGVAFFVAGVSGLLSLVMNLTLFQFPLLSVEAILPVVTIALVAVAASLSVNNLHTALAWAWNGYEQARLNEQEIRLRQAELRRVLKALDEATRRAERTNYMLVLARDQAEDARRLKQQFAQNISHELRTPLNLIVGFIELMIQSPEHYGSQLPPAYLRDLSIMHRNANHLQHLVNDVLDLARIEAAQMSLLPEPTDPANLVLETVNTARSLIEVRKLELSTKIEPNLPQLLVDPTRIRQVLFNLLNNAVRFTDQGGITIGVFRQEEEVIFTVTDTGIGIASDELPHIFEEFHQLDGSTRRMRGGAGLGLAISRRFVELHKGRIWVDSEVGRGSTFYFSLPVSQVDLVTVTADNLDETGYTIPPKWGEKGILLLVTRSPSAVALLDRYIHGFRTVVFQDLKQAQHAARQLMPQAVIIDIACKNFDPIKSKELAKAWNLPTTPFIACPLPGEDPLRQRLTVDGYLLKPVSRQKLWDVLRLFGQEIDRILVIDDDQDFVRLLNRMLDSPIRRYQVTSAYSGQEGLTIMQHHQPDLVLLDLGLPDMSGVQVIERIRAFPAWQHIPIVVVSAQGDFDYLETLNGPMLISKVDGLRPNELLQWIQTVLESTTPPKHSIGASNAGEMGLVTSG